MLLDPCTAPLVPGAFGDATVRLVRESYSYTVTVPASGSYHLLWMPAYHCPGGAEDQDGNLVAYTTQGPANTVANTIAAPWGAGSVGTSVTQTLTDPAYSRVSKSGVRDARTVAACAEIHYTGRTDAEAGQVGSFTAKLGNFFRTPAGGIDPSLVIYTANSVFDLVEQPRRPSHGAEVKYQPNFSADYDAWFGISNSALHIGEPAVAASTVDSTKLRTDDPSIIGLAVNAGTDAQSYRITLTKVFEVREDEAVGGLSSSSDAPITNQRPPIMKAAEALNGGTQNPDTGWQTTVLEFGKKYGARVVEGVIRGAMHGPRRRRNDRHLIMHDEL